MGFKLKEMIMGTKNQGEGDYESARHYNEETRKFVKDKTKKGETIKGDAKEATDKLTPAEETALKHSKGGLRSSKMLCGKPLTYIHAIDATRQATTAPWQQFQNPRCNCAVQAVQRRVAAHRGHWRTETAASRCGRDGYAVALSLGELASHESTIRA